MESNTLGNQILVVFEVGKVKFGKLVQLRRRGKSDQGRSKLEVVLLVQLGEELVQKVLVVKLVGVVWTNVVHGGHHQSPRTFILDEVFVEDSQLDCFHKALRRTEVEKGEGL